MDLGKVLEAFAIVARILKGQIRLWLHFESGGATFEQVGNLPSGVFVVNVRGEVSSMLTAPAAPRPSPFSTSTVMVLMSDLARFDSQNISMSLISHVLHNCFYNRCE